MLLNPAPSLTPLDVRFFTDRQVAPRTQCGLTETRSTNRDTAQRLFAHFGEHASRVKLGSSACSPLGVHGEHDRARGASSAAIAQSGIDPVAGSTSHSGHLANPQDVAAVAETVLVAQAA